MKLKSIKSKMGLTIGLTACIGMTALIAFTTIQGRKVRAESAKEHALALSSDFASSVKNRINKALNSVRVTASIFSMKFDSSSPFNMDRETGISILKKLIQDNPDFLGVASVWEPNAFDGKDKFYINKQGGDQFGRFIAWWKRDKGRVTFETLSQYTVKPYYQLPRKTRKEALIDPSFENYNDKKVMVMTISVPILKDSVFMGMVGADIPLTDLQKMVVEKGLYDGQADIKILADSGTIVASSKNSEDIGENIQNFDEYKGDFVRSVKQGKKVERVSGDYLEILLPLEMGASETFWTVAMRIPQKLIYAEAKERMWLQIIIGFIIVLISIGAVLITIKKAVSPLEELADFGEEIARGRYEYRDIRTSDDEIGRVYSAWSKVVDSLKETSGLLEKMALGDMDVKVPIKSSKDVLGKAVSRMRENLNFVVEQAVRVIDGDFSREIEPYSDKDVLGITLKRMMGSLKSFVWMRNGNDELNNLLRGEMDILELSQKVIDFVTPYTGAQIGLLYIVKDEKNAFLAGSYTSGPEIDYEKDFSYGEGLPGLVWKEEKTVELEDIPDNYIRIKSGIGAALPESIIGIPIFFNNKVKGVIELASLDEITEEHKEFIRRNLRNVGVAINVAESRGAMASLLQETQQKSEELQQQQEELRITNEELSEQTEALKLSEDKLKRQQEELRVINEELEEKTKDLEEQKDKINDKNKELEKARHEIEKKAEDLEISSKYKSEFLANMSHELRTPLNSILILSQLMGENRKGNLTEKQMEFAKTIHTSGEDLLNLINEVLDLSKIEAGKMILNVDDVNLSELGSYFQNVFRQIAASKGLSFEVIIEDDVPAYVKTDSQRLQQVIRNLLANAIKFTRKGGVSLRVFRSPEEKMISFEVKDSGIGIPADKQKVIFEAFQQADGTTSRKFGGTGLGLSISRELIKLLEGSIGLESTEGEGSTFTITVPYKIESKEPVVEDKREAKPLAKAPVRSLEPAALTIKEKAHIEEPAGKSEIRDDRKNLSSDDKSILIIEDDKGFSKILFDIAHEKGFKCLLAEDGETGVHFADYYRPKAIILDIGLPGIDGWEVMERLKDNPETRHIPVHFISAADKTLESLRMGAIGHLTKPVSIDMVNDVFGKIETVIDREIHRILVIEDDQIQRNSIIELIKDKDIEIKGVSGGEEAVDALKKFKYDCIILDLNLTDVSGFDLLTLIKSDENISKVPVIVYTGKELSREEEVELQKFAESIIIKGAKSPERLLAETTLFLHRVESDMPEEKKKMLNMVHDREAVFSERKILVVDDDMRNVFALTSVLESKNVEIIVARNGVESIEKLDSNPDTDLVLMDIMMPEMDGYEAMRRIRKDPRFFRLPIIALTAKAMKGDRIKCIEAGASDYLSKPVDTGKLLSLLRVWMYR